MINQPLRPASAGRDTRRKRLLREALGLYHGRAILLEELRWTVMVSDPKEADIRMTRSLMNSFARTVREQLPDFQVHKFPIDPSTPVGLLARMAVYRLRDSASLSRFLRGPSPSIACRYTTRVTVREPRYRKNPWAVAHHHAAIFELYEQPPSDASAGTNLWRQSIFIPGTHRISVIAPRAAPVDLSSLTNSPWKLCRATAIGWDQLDAMATLGSVEES